MILLNLTDMVQLILDYLPAARKAAAAAVVGVATGSAFSRVQANAARTGADGQRQRRVRGQPPSHAGGRAPDVPGSPHTHTTVCPMLPFLVHPFLDATDFAN